MTTIDGHTFDETLLTPGGWTLDVGARGFMFSEGLDDLGQNVLAIEPDRNVRYEGHRRIGLINAALIGTGATSAMYAAWSDGTGNMLCDVRPDHAEEYYDVLCTNISWILQQSCIDRFDLVKLDCEGSEYEILWNWPSRAALQISVEFHDFLGMRPRESWYDELLAGPLREYEVVQHEWTPLTPENPICNYWDSLFVLRPECR